MPTRVHLPDFRDAQTAAELAQYCGMPLRILERVTSDAIRERFYVKHEIKKHRPRGTTKTRTVWEVPEGPLRDAHKSLARRLDLFARLINPRYPHDAAYGYVRGRGTRQNAARHCGAPLLLRADIENFFPSISTGRLARTLTQLGLSATCANLLARFCTINDALALGFHASPLLANLVLLELDDKLSSLASNLSCTYTRYADDMAFSGRAVLPSRAELAGIVEAQGFRLSKSKYRITKRGQAHFVTGLSIADPSGPHVPRKMKRKLRLELYYCEKYGIDEHLVHRGGQSAQSGINRIDGLVRYISGIELSKQQLIRETWHSILKNEGVGPSYMPLEGRPFRSIAMLVDEAEFARNGSRNYLALACATTEELATIRFSAAGAAREYRADPFASGRPRKVDTKGLHFADVPENVRDDFVRRLAFQSFRSYIAFAPLKDKTDKSEYADVYAALLRALLPRRFMAADRAEVTIYVEQNPKIGSVAIENVVNDVYNSLQTANNRRPYEKPNLVIAKKVENPEIAVPDFLLGVVARYLDLHNGRTDSDRLRFERLRDKIRVVLDLENGIEFSRRRPLLPWDGAVNLHGNDSQD